MAAVEPEIALRCRARIVPADWLESQVLAAMPATQFDRPELLPVEIVVHTIGEHFDKSAQIAIEFVGGRSISVLCPAR